MKPFKNMIFEAPIRASIFSKQSLIKNSGHCIFLEQCFTIGFYVLATPFKIGRHGIQENMIQKFFCGFGYLCTIFQGGVEIRKSLAGIVDRSPVQYFIFFQRMGSTAVRVFVFKILWFDSEKFEEIVRYVQKYGGVLPPISRRKMTHMRIAVTIICVVYIIVAMGTWALGTHVTKQLSYQNFTEFYFKYVEEARYAFFIEGDIFSSINNFTSTLNVHSLSKISTSDHCITGLLFVVHFFRSIHGAYCDCIFLIVSLTLWIPSRALGNLALNELKIYEEIEFQLKSPSYSNILPWTTYKAIRGLSQRLNGALEWGLFAFVLDTVMYYSVNFNAIFVAPDWFRKMRIAIFVTGTSTAFISAADICRQMKHFKQWLLHNDDGSLDTRRNIGMILEDLRDETVSISGGLIKITFPFLGTIFTLMISYFIMCSV